MLKFLVLSALVLMLIASIVVAFLWWQARKSEETVIYQRTESSWMPKFAEPYLMRAKLKLFEAEEWVRGWNPLTRRDAVEQRIRDLTSRLGAVPDSMPLLRERGMLKLKKGETEQAIADFKEALQSKPDDSLTLYQMAISQLHKGDWGAGLRFMAEAQRTGYEVSDAWTDSSVARQTQYPALRKKLIEVIGTQE